MHIKLLPLIQKSFSPAFDAQLLYVGHVGQGHLDLKSAIRSACSLGVFFETLSMVFSNVSILHHASNSKIHLIIIFGEKYFLQHSSTPCIYEMST